MKNASIHRQEDFIGFEVEIWWEFCESIITRVEWDQNKIMLYSLSKWKA